MDTPKNKLFAIITTTLSDPDTGHCTGHTLGAIFDLDAKGMATDCTAIDFDGARIRRWPYDNFGKAVKLSVSHIPAERALFFPITEESAALLREAMEDLTGELQRGHNPFYRGTPALGLRARFEQHNRAPVAFDGNPLKLTHEGQLRERAAHCRPRAMTGCREFLQNLMEKVAGIPVDELTLEGRKMPRGMGVGANEMGKYIAYLAGNERANYMTHKNGRMIDMGQGRYAYAFDRSTGWITPELNGLKYTTADGRTMPLAQFLTQESKPFYDPALNGHDLGRSSQSGGASR